VRNIHTLWGLFGLSHTAVLFVILFENSNGQRRNRGQPVKWLPLQLAFIPHLFSWATVLCYFFKGALACHSIHVLSCALLCTAAAVASTCSLLEDSCVLKAH
jgi:hypothetical protein